MSERSAAHSTFVIERTYEASPERVFSAWADPAAKARWFGPSEKPKDAHTLDFQVGGREHLAVPTSDGPVYSFDATYQDIVPSERIIYTYDMHRDEARISVSVATVVLQAQGAGTRLTLTEQGVFLDGLDTSAEREHGTNVLMDMLGTYLKSSGEST